MFMNTVCSAPAQPGQVAIVLKEEVQGSSNRCKFTLFMSWESAKLLIDISTVF